MAKEISTVFVDSERHTVSEDKSHIIAATNKKHNIDNFGEMIGQRMPILVVPPETFGEGVVMAFSTEARYEKWLAENKLDNRHAKKILELQRSLTKDEMKAVKQHQVKEVREVSDTHRNLLKKKHGPRSTDIDKFEDTMLSGYDPYLGLHNPAYTLWVRMGLHLYDEPWFGGEFRVLPGDWWWGRLYPDLGWFGFTDRAASLAMPGSWQVQLFEHTNFGGRRLCTYTQIVDLYHIWNWFGRDIASSAMVF